MWIQHMLILSSALTVLLAHFSWCKLKISLKLVLLLLPCSHLLIFTASPDFLVFYHLFLAQ